MIIKNSVQNCVSQSPTNKQKN